VTSPDLARRRLLALGGAAALGLLTGCGGGEAPKAAAEATPRTPTAALTRLMDGNRRFVNGTPLHPAQAPDRRAALASGQKPFAMVLGCMDSRVPPEIVFDQGLGDMLVARSAGQVLDDAVLGSLEYGVEHLGVPLVLVLGHEGCGAVGAALEVVETGGKAEGHIADLVAAIRPAVERTTGTGKKRAAAAVTENVRLVTSGVRKLHVVAERAEKRKVRVVGARYDLDRGLVELV